MDHPVPLDRSGTDAIDGMGRVGWLDRKVGGIWGTIQQQAISSFAGRIVYALCIYIYIYTHVLLYLESCTIRVCDVLIGKLGATGGFLAPAPSGYMNKLSFPY